MTQTPFLQIKNLRKSYDRQTIVDIEYLSVEANEIFSILGPSGCGKTTFLRLLAGLESPDEGSIILNGQDITDLAPNQRKINTVFQNYALFPHMTVWQNIAFGLKLKKLSSADIEKEISKVLELTQMSDYADKYPRQLSGGQKQRVAIARALVLRPQILLLDEPLAALDLKLRQRMLLELDLIHDEVEINFIFITHDQGEAMSISDRIAVMNHGRIEQVASPQEIYESPKNSFIAAFIGDTNVFTCELQTACSDKHIASVEIEKLGQALCHCDRNFEMASHAQLCVRPEKISISKRKPENKTDNLFSGLVQDVIYLGAQTKYWVAVGDYKIMVLRAHEHFYNDDEVITWNDQVYLWWEAHDSFLLDIAFPIVQDSHPALFKASEGGIC